MKFFRFRANDKSIRAANVANIAIENNIHAGGTAFGFEHVHDLARGMVAEELAEIFLMEGNAVFFDQGDEIRRRVARQGRLCEVRIGRQEIFRTAVEVCEIATASAGNEDFSAGAVPSLEHSDAPPAFTRFDGAQQTGRAGADNDSVVLAGHWVMVRFCGMNGLAPSRITAADYRISLRGWGIREAFAMANIDFVDWTSERPLAKVTM